MRSEKEQSRRHAAEQKHKDLARRNKEWKQRLSQVRGRDAKCLDDEVESARIEMEKARRQEKKDKLADIAKHKNDLENRVAGASGRDSKSLDIAIEAARRQKARDREEAIKQNAKDLMKDKAELQARVEEAKSPIQSSLSDAASFSLSRGRSNVSSPSHNTFYGSPLKGTKSELSIRSHYEDAPVSDSPGSTTSSRMSLGHKRIVEAQARNVQLMQQNALLRQRLGAASAAAEKG